MRERERREEERERERERRERERERWWEINMRRFSLQAEAAENQQEFKG